jgi:hypothetical protein
MEGVSNPVNIEVAEMTDAICRPVALPVPVRERERRADPLGELLECLADLLVETAAQREVIERSSDRDDQLVRDAIERLIEVEGALKRVGLEAASAHQQLQHEHLI